MLAIGIPIGTKSPIGMSKGIPIDICEIYRISTGKKSYTGNSKGIPIGIYTSYRNSYKNICLL